MTKKTSPSEKEETAKVDIAPIKVLALWKGFSPDCRPYKPSTPIIEFPEPLIIAIDVPLTNDLIKNAGVISAAQLTNQSEPKPHFTPLGMRYIIDQFEAVMKNGEPEQDTAKADDDWEDEDTKKETNKKSEDDDWDEESEDTSGESEEKFDDDKDWEE